MIRICMNSLLAILLLSCFCGTCIAEEWEDLEVDTKLISVVKEQGTIKRFSWSPDGKMLSYQAGLQTNWGCQQDIMLVDLENLGPDVENVRHLNTEGPLACGASITWSSDAKKVVLRDGIGIRAKSYVVGLKSRKKSEIPVPENWVIFWESYSPFANIIVCNAVYADTTDIKLELRINHLDFYRPWRIAVIDLDKSDFRLIPEDSSEGEQFSPDWSPDGKSITYCAAREGIESFACSCYSLDLTTGIKRKIYEKGEEYDFNGISQDGSVQILAKYDRSEGRYLGAWAVKTDGSGERWRLTDSLAGKIPTAFYREVFSPDLRFVADPYMKDNKSFLRIRDLETGKQRLLDAYLQPNDYFPLAWSQDSRRVCYLRQDPQFSFPLIQIMMATIED